MIFLNILMRLFTPFVYLYLRIIGVKIGKGAKFYGFPLVYKSPNSKILIGDRFECRSWWFSNPLGLNHPVILCTWQKGAKLEIGDDVGVSGGSIVAASEVKIGDRVLIGANSTIIDTDFHPTTGNKRYAKENIKSKKVYIGSDSFIGMHSTILKGVNLIKDSIVPAGGVIR